MAGWVVASAGGVILVGAIAAAVSTGVDDKATGSLDVTAHESGNTTVLDVTLSVDASEWQVANATFSLSPSARLLGSPEGWECEPAPVGYTCSTSLIDATGGEFTFGTIAGALSYDLTIDGTAGTHEFDGHAWGSVSPTSSSG